MISRRIAEQISNSPPTGVGTPRSRQGRAAAVLALGLAIYTWLSDHARALDGRRRPSAAHHDARSLHEGVVINLSVGTCATGCYGGGPYDWVQEWAEIVKGALLTSIEP